MRKRPIGQTWATPENDDDPEGRILKKPNSLPTPKGTIFWFSKPPDDVAYSRWFFGEKEK